MKKKIFNIFRGLVLFAACVGFTYASYSLTKSYLGYQNADAAYSEINDMFMQTQASDENKEVQTNESVNASKDEADSSVEMGYSKDTKKWVWDYEAMLKYNSEALGYIKLNDSRIQYPIVQHSDNKYYLNHGSNRIFNGNGAIFVDSRIQGGLDAQSCIVYGHDMLDGSMFAGLLDYSKKDFCKNHQVFDIYIGYRHYRYYVFSSFTAKATDEKIYKMGFKDDADYQSWIDRCYEKSNYTYNTEKPTTDDKTILLSTCMDDHDSRFIVVLVRGEEVVD